MRLHRQCRQPIAGAFQQRGQRARFACNPHPKRLLLRRVQHQPLIGCPLLPSRADEVLPIENPGRGPCAQPLGLPCAMKSSRQSTRRAVAGRHHLPARPQPFVDLYRQRVHSCFILRQAGSVPCAVADVESMMNQVQRVARRP